MRNELALARPQVADHVAALGRGLPVVGHAHERVQPGSSKEGRRVDGQSPDGSRFPPREGVSPNEGASGATGAGGV